VSIADQLTVARIAATPLIVLLYILDFQDHDYWATGSSPPPWPRTGSTGG
jgi:hypothetical protein